MERTRDEVVRILHDRGTCSVAELADAIGVSAGSARRHLDLMIGEGLVDVRLERQRRGRPVTRYSLSEAGEERSASVHYARLLERIYPALNELPEAAVSGQDGAAVLARVFEGIADEVARAYAPRVHSASLGARVVEVANALRGEGILTDVVSEDGQYRLRNVGCPYRSTAEGTHVACAADRRTIELLLGEPVQQLTTIVEGSPSCEYIVSKVSTRLSELHLSDPGERVATGRPVPALTV
jgi:DeoR family transcriptional regulator, suf operon transcriptional repressor